MATVTERNLARKRAAKGDRRLSDIDKRDAGKKNGSKADKYVKTIKKAVKGLPKRKKGVYGKK